MISMTPNCLSGTTLTPELEQITSLSPHILHHQDNQLSTMTINEFFEMLRDQLFFMQRK